VEDRRVRAHAPIMPAWSDPPGRPGFGPSRPATEFVHSLAETARSTGPDR
jgi:hypothetical protein